MTGPLPGGPERGWRRSRPLLRTMIGDVLRRTRLEQERTLSEVARHASVSMPYLSEIERGLKEASSEVLAAICDALGIGLADLLEEVGRELAVGQARSTEVFQVIRLDGGRDATGGLGGPGAHDARGQAGRGQATCLLAA